MARRLSSFCGLSAYMYGDDHPVVHVHIYSGNPQRGSRAALVFRVDDATIMKRGGEFPAAKVSIARDWVALRQEQLFHAWQQIRRGEVPTKIAPPPGRGSKAEGSPVLRMRLRADLLPQILLLESLGHGRLRITLHDGRVFLRERFRFADTARAIHGGYAVHRFKGDRIGVSTMWLVRGTKYLGQIR